MESEITIQVECEGNYIRGVRERFDNSFGNYMPAEYAEIEGFRVFITKTDKESKKSTRLEITEYLSEHDHEVLYKEYLQMCMEE